MSRFILALLLSLSFALIGCGGGGGDGDGDDIIGDDQLIGDWLAVSAFANSEIQSLSDAMDYDTGITKQIIEFADTGACYFKNFTGSVLTSTETGTWFAENQAGTITMGSEVTPFNYMVFWADNQPWMARVTFSEGGQNLEVNYVKVVTLTAHHPDMVKTVALSVGAEASRLTLDGDPSTIQDAFGCDPTSDTMTMQFLSNGTLIGRELKENDVVNIITGTWATGGGTFIMNHDSISTRGYFDAGAYTFTYLDEEMGNTVVVAWDIWSVPGDHPSSLVGQWEATGISEDGVPIDLATFFEWEAEVDSMVYELWGDGAVEAYFFDGSDILYSRFGKWGVDGTELTMSFDVDSISDYEVVGTTATMTWLEGGHEYILTMEKV